MKYELNNKIENLLLLQNKLEKFNFEIIEISINNEKLSGKS